MSRVEKEMFRWFDHVERMDVSKLHRENVDRNVNAHTWITLGYVLKKARLRKIYTGIYEKTEASAAKLV